MSINQEWDERKGTSLEIPSEEEFEIVSINKAQNSRESQDLKKHLLNIVVIILIASASFGLGRFSFYKDKEVSVTIRSEKTFEDEHSTTPTPEVKGAVTSESTSQSDGIVVGSKNSTKYHFPWCSGAKNIAAANLITFASIEEARKAGYIPAANCKGLK